MVDITNMSDEEILNLPDAPIEVSNTEAVEQEAQQADVVQEQLEEAQAETTNEPVVEQEASSEEEQQEETVVEEVVEPDYKAFYEKVTSNFKASGQSLEIKSPDEVVSLMQKGVDYSRKTMELSSQRKYLLMLENNGLLDEGKLSYLIDLDKKNPDAVKKLLQDSGIDALEINPEEPVNYVANNHSVSNDEVAFRSNLEAVLATPTGQATIDIISSSWDEVSKEALLSQPEAILAINEQKANGVYDTISAEINRRKTFGQMPAHLPFIQAYLAVGNEMSAQNNRQQVVQEQAPTPKLVRTQPVKAVVDNSDKLAAVAPTRTTAAAPSPKVNPYMSDDDLMKFMAQN